MYVSAEWQVKNWHLQNSPVPSEVATRFFYTEPRQVFHASPSLRTELCSRMPGCPLRVGSWLLAPAALTTGCSTDKWVLSEPTQPWTTFFSYICQPAGGQGLHWRSWGTLSFVLVTYVLLLKQTSLCNPTWLSTASTEWTTNQLSL